MNGRPLPALARAIIRLVVPADWREPVAGDLEEEQARRIAAGRRVGLRWTLRASATAMLTGVRLTSRRALWPRVATDFRDALRNLVAHRG